MTFDRLRIAGPRGGPCALGEPMHVHDGSVELGTLDPVDVSRDGTEVLIGRFIPSPFVRARRRNFGPLVLLEVTSFIAERFQGVQVVSYSLSREIELHGDGMQVATARSALLQSMGAERVTISPQPDSGPPGNFVVQGVWTYNAQNLAALRACLELERQNYRRLAANEDKLDAAPTDGLGQRLRRWLGGDR
jgi:hypothetical protein